RNHAKGTPYGHPRALPSILQLVTWSRKHPQGEKDKGAKLYLYFPFTIRRQCSHAARIKFSLASGVRKAECADSVTFSSFVKGWSAGSGSMLKTSRPAWRIWPDFNASIIALSSTIAPRAVLTRMTPGSI